MIGPSRESPSRNFSPANTPFCCAAASTRLPARTTIAITRNEKTYVQPSTTSTVDGAGAADDHAGQHRACELRQLVRTREDGVDARDRLLVLARDLRDDEPRRGEVRSGEDPDRERRAEQRREREVPRSGGGSG